MESKEAPLLALREAVNVAGSQTAFAKAVGRSQSMVSLWLTRNMLIPAECVLDAEKATGISRHDLRPDLYPRDETPARRPAEHPPEPASRPQAEGSGGPLSDRCGDPSKDMAA